MKEFLEDLRFLKERCGNSYIMALLSNRGIHCLLFYRLSHLLYRYRIPLLPLILTRIIQIVYGVDIDYRAQLKGGIIIVHGIGLVIGSGVIIKSKVTLFHQVTIGVRGGENKDMGFAIIEQNCTIYTGAKILGSITIGENSIIGANVVVTKDIPINSIVTTDTKLLIRERQIKL